jgi:hypothetical protein
VTPTQVPGVLVVYHRPDYKLAPIPFADAATVREHIHAVREYSGFPVWEVNSDLGFPIGLRDVHPAVMFLHYSLFGSGSYHLGEELFEFVRSCDAMKVAFFQDEFYFCRKRFAFVNEAGVDLVLTHVHTEDIPHVWGRYAPRTRARFNYPGYVSPEIVAAAERFALPAQERDIDVGYRGRPLQPFMGSGALEKVVIGERFKELAAGGSLRLDIDTSEDGRLYGDAWYGFLGRCNTVLGVESGTSYLDLEDEVYGDYEKRLAEGRPVTLEALLEGPLGRWDHNFSYRTISPRHFEAAAFRICQVLLEGEYSGVLQPMVHYVPLKKDFSNFDEVVALISDPKRRREITDNAHRDLIASGAYSYARFVADIDADLIAAGQKQTIERRQRKMVETALRRGRLRRRVRTEARYLSVVARLIIGRRLPARARAKLGLPPDAFDAPDQPAGS